MKERENFLDKNTLIAVALVFVAWLSWDAYMRKKYPMQTRGESLQEREETREKNQKEYGRENSLKSKKNEMEKSFDASSQMKEQVFSFQSENMSFDISSSGMGFKKLVLNRILDRNGQAILLFSGEKDLLFETRIKGRESRPLYFDIERVSDYSWQGQALLNEVKIHKTVSVDPKLFLIKTQVRVSGNLDFVSGISLFLTQAGKEGKKGLFSFLSQPDFLSFFVSSSKGFEHIPLISKEASQVEKIKSRAVISQVKIAALGTKYFGQAWMENESDVSPEFRILFKDNKYLGFVSHSILNPRRDFESAYNIFVGPKDLSLLKKEYPSLTPWVDFGWFGFLSRLILQILQIFYSLVGNWGFSIILLTLLVRLLLLPVLVSAHRSMEVTKKLHPEMEKIRKKFKKDPQRKNQEIMALMKSHRANPLLGCLPLLAQTPIFWALWKALANSYSLYRAPFVFWIQDLSWKDPYYVLPVLMGLIMFVQQKITPVTMNKEMMRAMQIMPVFMALFMINLPSGLVLYMLVSSAFGLAQQMYLNRKEKGALPLPLIKLGKEKTQA